MPIEKLIQSCVVYLELCTVSLHFFDVTRHSVDITQTVLILLEDCLSTLCVTDDHFYSLESGARKKRNKTQILGALGEKVHFIITIKRPVGLGTHFSR